MRFIVEIRHAGDAVEGEVRSDGATESQPFKGWIELLRLLEPPPSSDPVKGDADG
ncbi:hypothetical protein [Pseudofrankia sp. BMG5.37]|uniref:hypothetical protein n=1 Tax=Pseudofrankia sp. BMG5.37 TaxID=3050035 RepID=UPI0028961475|nr:hypothetical protein [Pseudofrankia sp. BMG5.37]MDT3446046.1 hypothetical protein [Pseudofrankia sp. BMG5.37]